MPDNSIDPMVIDDIVPGGGFGGGGGGSFIPEPGGGGRPTPQSAGSTDEYGMRRRMGQRRGMPMQGPQSILGQQDQGVDPQMVAQIAQMFAQMFGGQGGAPDPFQGQHMQQIGNRWQMAPPQDPRQAAMGGLPFRAFAQGGVVTRPTIGLLGENGPEAVVPLSKSQPYQMTSKQPPGQMANRWNPFGQGDQSGPRPQLPSGWGQPPPAPQEPDIAGYGGIPWFLGGAERAGFFGPNPPQAIMEGMRSRIIGDNAAQARSARLGLMGRTDIDPSTYGFQALMSDLQGQKNLQQGLSGADLALRMKQMEFLQGLMRAEQGYGHQRALAQQQKDMQGGFGFGDLLGPLGTIAGAAIGGPAGAAIGGSLGGAAGGGASGRTTGAGGGGYQSPPAPYYGGY